MHAARLSLGAIFLIAMNARAADPVVKIGDTVERLTFKDIRYLPRSLADFKDRKAFVLVFANTTCPVVQRYLPVLSRLEKEYRSKGVQFLAVNVGADDSISAMAAQAVQHEMEFPFVKDFEAVCARQLGVARTPEVVILDGQRKLLYRGRIDDQYRLGGARQAPTRNDLKEALDELLAGKAVSVAETPVDGCVITRVELPEAKQPITFAEHVAPLLKKHCVECHRPNTAAPFSLVTYEQAAAKANTIAEVVSEQRMPPWYASPEHTHFINRRGMTAAERQTILQWVRGGKQAGDVARLKPLAPAVEKRWEIGQPDLILKAGEHELPAEGVVPYKYNVLFHVFLEDTWLQGVQILPDNPRVVHHCNMAFVKIGEEFRIANFITGYVPGGDAMTLADKVAVRIPAGSVLALQIHYVTTGKPEKCRVSVGLKYANGTIDKRLRFHLLADYRFAIPPEAPAHPVSASYTLPHNAVAMGLFAHMHLRGKDMTFRASYPDGKSETLLIVPNYNFDWQMPYRYALGAKTFPKGTKLDVLAHYDNSSFNPYNPNPKATVRDGLQTHNEMMNGFVFFVDADEKLGLEVDGKTGVAKAAGKE